MGGIVDKIDAITDVTQAYWTTIPPAPKSVKIELSPRCNLRCGFCALRTRENQPKTDMDFALFQRITQEMRDAGVEEIGLFYLGESTMNPSLLVSALHHVKALGFPYVFLTTNGTMLEQDVARHLFAGGLDSLKFSMNASDEEQYEKVMGVKGRLLLDAVRNLKAAAEMRERMGAKCGIYASSIQYDGEQQERMQAFLDKHVIPFVDEHYYLPLFSNMAKITVDRANELGFTPTAGNQGRVGALRHPLPCWSAFTEGHVRADGGLSACCFDSDGTFEMGNLRDTPFMKAWNSPKFQELRAAHLAFDVKGTICEGCLAYS
jgi:MoaA/NifB/PqqE/SkfB family radical SAM enzyme